MLVKVHLFYKTGFPKYHGEISGVGLEEDYIPLAPQGCLKLHGNLRGRNCRAPSPYPGKPVDSHISCYWYLLTVTAFLKAITGFI